MRGKILSTIFAGALIISTAGPLFFAAPQKAHAQLPTFDASVSASSILNIVQSTISAVADKAAAASTYALVINKYVLEPLAFVVSGNAIKSITGGVINFINGNTNGTGQSQFVQNLQGHLQGAGDTQANAFFFQFGKNSNSPFARSINSSLRTRYFQDTSLRGFFDANQCTLGDYSPNQGAFLAGDWSQGGAAAWFALTTQDQNNPYMLHQNAQRELALMVQDKTAARLNELAWGGGILSWCGGTSEAVATEVPAETCDPTTQSCAESASLSCDPTVQSCSGVPNPTRDEQVDAAPGDACTNSDGTPGTIQTPGTAIKGYLDKTLGLNADKFTAMGNSAGQINSILGSMVTVMETANFATQILGSASVNGATAGLAGSSKKDSYGRSYLDRYQDSPGYLGATEATVNRDASKIPAASTKQLLDNAKKYEAAWNVIRTEANSASTNLTALVNACTTSNALLATSAQNALASEVGPVLTQAATATQVITEARALVARLDSQANSSDSRAYSADVQMLQSTPPTGEDIAFAERESRVSDTEIASSTNPLATTGGTLMERMGLIAANALSLRGSCPGVPTR